MSYCGIAKLRRRLHRRLAHRFPNVEGNDFVCIVDAVDVDMLSAPAAMVNSSGGPDESR
jgi:hypothetical protein